MIAYHFTSDVLRDGRPVPAIGEKLIHHGEVIPCKSGLHASIRPADALMFALGHILHRVEMGGEIVEHGGDKIVGTERTILATINAEHLMRRFAADQALSVAHLWDMPEIAREYLTSPDAASAAAWPAASAAARDAAYAAAWDAWPAASAAARDARSAASAAARDAACAAASAAWSATRPAASAAARSAASAASAASGAACAASAAWSAAYAARSAASAASAASGAACAASAANAASTASRSAWDAAWKGFDKRVEAAFAKREREE